MKCKICGSEAKLVKKALVRKKYETEYFLCPVCDFLFIDDPVWLEDAYKNPINISDTGYVLRNIYLAKKTLILFTWFFKNKGTFVDYAGGYGLLTRIMRDYGLDFLWSDQYTKNIFAYGFEYTQQPVTAVTCFECFEHFLNPIEEINKLLQISNNVFFSTRIREEGIIPGENWEYYGLNHGQHISFYSLKTLQFLAKKYGLNLYSDKANLHFLTTKKISPLIFRALLFLNKLQIDLIIKKLLKSKTTTDSSSLNKIY